MSKRPALVWRQLDLPATTHPDAVRACLVDLAGLPGQPQIVLETIARSSRASWRVGSDVVTLQRVDAVIRTHLPETRLTKASSVFDGADQLSAAGTLRIRGSRDLPLANAQSETVARSLLGVLAGTRSHEVVRLQLLLGPRTRPRRARQLDGVARTVVKRKVGAHGFGCALRIAAQANTKGRAHHLVTSTAAAFRGLDVPGLSLHLGRIGPGAVVAVRTPFLWPLWLSVDDLVPLLGWPVAKDPSTELPATAAHHPRVLPATKLHPSTGRTFGLATADLSRGVRRPLGLRDDDALRHVHVMGPTGVGKSVLLAHGILSDIASGKGMVVIDPKHDLIDDLLARIPKHRLDDVVVLDARDEAPVGINPLVGGDPDLAADTLLAVFHSLFENSWGPRTSDILHASLLTLARRGDASLAMVPLLLTNPGFRRSVTGQARKSDPLGLGAFWSGFDALTDGEREQSIRPLLNKLRQVMLRPSLRGIFGQRTPKFDLAEVFSQKKILLVALGKDAIGPEAAQLLGSVVVAQLWQAILGRARVSPTRRSPVMVYIDEVQDYLRLPGSLGDALAQARGLGVGFTVAHQHRGQLGRLLDDIEANTRTKLYFALGARDAREVAHSRGGRLLVKDDFELLPAFHAYAQLLVGNQAAPWVSVTTEPLPPPLRPAESVHARSTARYGRALSETEDDLLQLVDAPQSRTTEAASNQSRTSSAGFGRERRQSTNGNQKGGPS